MGATVTVNLQDALQANNRQLVVKLKKLDGKWLITDEEVR
jgi:hypothetical protein